MKQVTTSITVFELLVSGWLALSQGFETCSWYQAAKSLPDRSRTRLDHARIESQEDFRPLQYWLLPDETIQVDRLKSSDLAYIGDVVYELFVRSRVVWPPKRTADLQNQVVAQVRGEFLL